MAVMVVIVLRGDFWQDVSSKNGVFGGSNNIRGGDCVSVRVVEE